MNEDKIFNDVFIDLIPLLNVNLEDRKDEFYIKVEQIVNDNISRYNDKLKWDENTPCGEETFTNEDFLETLKGIFHYGNKKVWYLLAFFIIVFMFIPYILVQKKYKFSNPKLTNILNTTAMDSNDIIIVFINIALFTILTWYLFTRYLAEDIVIIADRNINVYLNIIKADHRLTEIIKKSIKKVIEENRVKFEKYEKWKNDCNQVYIDRSWFFTKIVIGCIFLIYMLDRYFSKEIKLNEVFIKSLLFICVVFSTELFMLNFVFLKIYVTGEIDLMYKVLNNVIKKL